MKKIIFVCTGNTCRSPMAEAFLKDIIKKHGNKDIQVESRGISVVDRVINEKTLKSLQKFGIINYTHIPTQLTKKEIEESDLILTMTLGQKEAISSTIKTNKVFSIGEYIEGNDIADPYGQGQPIYDEVARNLKDSCEKIYSKI